MLMERIVYQQVLELDIVLGQLGIQGSIDFNHELLHRCSSPSTDSSTCATLCESDITALVIFFIFFLLASKLREFRTLTCSYTRLSDHWLMHEPEQNVER